MSVHCQANLAACASASRYLGPKEAPGDQPAVLEFYHPSLTKSTIAALVWTIRRNLGRRETHEEVCRGEACSMASTCLLLAQVSRC